MYHGERMNAISHLLGLLLAAVGVPALIARACDAGDPGKIAVATVFGMAILAVYAASTLFHSVRGPSKALWAKADHCAIYLLIAGTCTPLALVAVRGPRGWMLFFLEWSLALLGIAKELCGAANAAPSVVLYVFMGWAGVLGLAPLLDRLPAQGSVWLLLGATFYTVGIVFYALEGRLRHAHAIWHLFVLSGTSSHFFTVWAFVI